MRKAKEEAGLKGERERRSKSSLNVWLCMFTCVQICGINC
jgi:hypothetical protein